MNQFVQQLDIQSIRSQRHPNSVTIYASVSEPSTRNESLRITVKNFLSKARILLKQQAVTTTDIDDILTPIADAIDSKDFLNVINHSAVFFSNPEFHTFYMIDSVHVHSELTISSTFDTAPLEKILKANKKFQVLVIGHKRVMLYEGDSKKLSPVRLKHFPLDMRTSLGIDEFKKSRETHAIAPAWKGKGSRAYHEQYNVAESDKKMLQQFFSYVDKRLHTYLTRHQEPLVLAGVSYIQALYRKANTYPNLLKTAVNGNFDHTTLPALHKKVQGVLRKEHVL